MEFGGKVKKRRKEQKEVVSIKYQILSWKRKRKNEKFSSNFDPSLKCSATNGISCVFSVYLVWFINYFMRGLANTVINSQVTLSQSTSTTQLQDHWCYDNETCWVHSISKIVSFEVHKWVRWRHIMLQLRHLLWTAAIGFFLCLLKY